MADLFGMPAGVPAEDYADVLQSQRQQMLANALLQNALSPIQQPEAQSVRGIAVQPRVSAFQGLSKIASALLGNRASDKAIQSQIASMQALNQSYAPGGQMTNPGTPLQAAPPAANPNEQSVQPAVTRAPGQSFAQTVQGTQPTYSPGNPRNPYGMPADVVRNLAMSNPAEYAKMLQGPEWLQAARIAGIDPQQAAYLAAGGKPMGGERAGTIAYDPLTRRPIWSQPDLGKNVQLISDGRGGVVSVPIPGNAEAQGSLAGRVEAEKAQNTPHYEQDPFHPGQVEATYPPTPPALQPGQPPAAGPPAPARSPPAANSSRPGNTAADLEAEKEGGKSGQVYAAELAKNATGATEVRRSLSELRNLAGQSTPSAMNEGKMKLGSYMIAAGISPQTAANWLGVDVGALQAAQKQTATLAVNTIHSMTSRGTNFDLDTFMRNNPNLNMADPSAFGRVVDYMDSKAKQEIAKQKDFVQWKKGHAPDEWESGHTAHWLDLQNQLIDQGKSNSRPPLSSFVRQ